MILAMGGSNSGGSGTCSTQTVHEQAKMLSALVVGRIEDQPQSNSDGWDLANAKNPNAENQLEGDMGEQWHSATLEKMVDGISQGAVADSPLVGKSAEKKTKKMNRSSGSHV